MGDQGRKCGRCLGFGFITFKDHASRAMFWESRTTYIICGRKLRMEIPSCDSDAKPTNKAHEKTVRKPVGSPVRKFSGNPVRKPDGKRANKRFPFQRAIVLTIKPSTYFPID